MTTATESQKTVLQADSDVHITFEDQQKINKFARYNAKLNDIKEELNIKERDIQNLDDASDELLLLDDESTLVPYMMGEVFLLKNSEEVQKLIDDAKSQLTTEKEGLLERVKDIKNNMQELKVALYAKFGSNINLEADD